VPGETRAPFLGRERFVADETEVLYARLDPASPCVCGNPEGHPVKVADFTVTIACESCWNHLVAKMMAKKADFEAKTKGDPDGP
jgi:hypothetical protein